MAYDLNNLDLSDPLLYKILLTMIEAHNLDPLVYKILLDERRPKELLENIRSIIDEIVEQQLTKELKKLMLRLSYDVVCIDKFIEN